MAFLWSLCGENDVTLSASCCLQDSSFSGFDGAPMEDRQENEYKKLHCDKEHIVTKNTL